jgi:hypothetical protein
MKAVRQIIDYLRSTGVLDKAILQELAAKGFILDEHPKRGFDPDRDDERGAGHLAPGAEHERQVLEAEELEDSRASKARRPSPKRRQNVLRKGKILDAGGIAELLRTQCFPSWPVGLDGLIRLARRIAGGAACSSWDAAARIIRTAPAKELTAAVLESLTRRDPPFDEIWNALAVDDYRYCCSQRFRGPAVAAYRAILAAQSNAGTVGKHIWLLRSEKVGDDVARVCNVCVAQRQIARAFEPLLSSHPQVIGNAIRHDHSLLGSKVLVLVYNARRGSPGHRPLKSSHEKVSSAIGLLHPHEWALAAAVDSRRVMEFLGEWYRWRNIGVDEIVDILMKVLREDKPARALLDAARAEVGAAEWDPRSFASAPQAMEAAIATVEKPLLSALQSACPAHLSYGVRGFYWLAVHQYLWNDGSHSLTEADVRSLCRETVLLCPEAW